MDRIALRGIRAYGRHGADPGERERRQCFAIDVVLRIDLEAAAKSDDLTQTLDYAELQKRVVRVVATTSYALLERLGAELLDAVFADVRVARATISIAKPEILDGATPSITLDRPNPRHRLR